MNLELFIDTNGYDTKKPMNATPEEYLEKMITLFNKYSLQKENVTNNQWNILQEIIDNKKMIEEKLSPLNGLCDYTLDIVGGALRDIMMGKENEVNDYDIVINPGYIKIEKIMSIAQSMNILIDKGDKTLNEMKEFRIKIAKEQKETKGYDWGLSDQNDLLETIEINYYFSKIVNKLMLGSKEYKYYGANNVQEKYLNYHITSINQFTGVNDKKVDLIVSEYGGDNFLSTFDFELCKIFANLKNITNKEELLENIVPLGSMLRDVDDNTLSVNAIKFPVENLKYFFNKHLLKLMDKYPNHKVNLFSIKDNKEFTEEENFRWVFANKLKIEANLPGKGNDIKKLKI